MQTLQLTNNGGMPLTQEVLAQLQAASTMLGGVTGGLAYEGSTLPIIITGAKTYAITVVNPGYLFYNGEIMYFEGGDIDVFASIKVVTLTSTAVYEDGSTQVLFKERRLRVCLASDPDAICLWTDVKIMQKGLGVYAEDYSSVLTKTVPSLGLSLSGTVNFRINELAKTVHVWGTIGCGNATMFTNPPLYRLLFNSSDIPAAYFPAFTVPFKMFVRYHSTNYILETAGTEHILDVNAEFSSTGDFSVGFIKAAAGVTSYTLTFNVQLPLK